MRPEDILLGLIFVNIVSAVGWVRAHAARRRAEQRLWEIAHAEGLPMSPVTGQPMPRAAVTSGDRVQQLEAQVDHLAQQLDRVAESQDFLTRMMVDRVEQLPDARLRTPH